MPGFSVEKNGFLDMDSLMESFITDLTTVGATLTPAFAPFKIIKNFPGTVVLESDSDFLLGVDQPWRMAFEVGDGLKLNIATPIQIDNTGYVSNASWLATIKSGQLSNDSPTDPMLVSYTEWGIQNLLDVNSTTSNWPLSYRLTVTSRGLVVLFWGEALTTEWSPCISWFAVQRPVHPDTGAPLIKGKCPLFCVYSKTGGKVSLTDADLYPEDGIRQFIVREIDINVPRKPFSAVYHTNNGNAIINPTKQIAFTENKEYLVTFPNGLVTSRYAYIHEFDLFAYTSADVIPSWVVAEITMYGESTPRKYVSLPANGPRESNMRLLLLIDGGGVTFTSPDPATYVGTR